MSTLRFVCKFHSMEMQSLTLPVEIRKSNYSLVRRALSNESVELPPGTYFVSAQTPSGQQLTNQVTLGEGDSRTVALYLEQEDVSPHEHEEVPRFIQQNQTVAPFLSSNRVRPGAGAGGEPAAKGDEGEKGLGDSGSPLPGPARLILYRGNPLDGGLGYQPDLHPFFPPRQAYLDLPGAFVLRFNPPQPDLIQVAQPGRAPLNAVLPSWLPRSLGEYNPLGGCQVVVRPRGSAYSLEVFLENVRSESLLRYNQRSQTAQANLAAQNFELNEDRHLMSMAEDGLKDKIRDPLTAAAGAYTLLRLNDLEHLHNWTRNLMDWFPWLPDGIPIYAEHMARLGKHAEALEALLRLPERGLPFFSDGLSYAVDRLRFYRRLYPSGAQEPAAALLLDRLRPYAAFADFGKPILTFTGDDPNRPSGEPMEAFTGLPGLEF